MGNRDSLSQSGGAELFARDETVDYDPSRETVIGFEKLPDGVEEARLGPGIEVKKNIPGWEQFGDLAHTQ